MSDMTYNTIVFSGTHAEIETLDQIIGEKLNFDSIIKTHPDFQKWTTEEQYRWMKENWGSTFCEITEKIRQNHDGFSTMKLVFQTPYNPPLKVIDALYSKCPGVKGIHKLTLESDWCESIYVRRDPERGFQKFLVDDSNGFHLEDNSPSFELVEGYVEELMINDELRIVSEIVGVTLDWINSKKSEIEREMSI